MSRMDKVAVVGTGIAVAGMSLWMMNMWLDQVGTAQDQPKPASESQTFQTTPDATAPALGARGTYTVEVKSPAPVNVASQTAEPGSGSIPECKVEDGSGQNLCIWRGDQDGNGKGATYIVYLGEFYYLDVASQ